ncbi:TIGR04141 family sporadically distributed protein [Photobacterium sp. OFAV2-7]|uniref:TIGR04141 family sporadically distributed protein n=1 Tax=Photobacterium sp. OFAV2-7 TaxID=2917748 RepID=UPI001EF58EC3|nr:TIGR04141 family sporadically distributed protein [Photobacterium sp. OFAV2-7]MCG7584792.1 TIGR04141 family sporadically distributed protein [Photobacterium sp. OFAV2-7]
MTQLTIYLTKDASLSATETLNLTDTTMHELDIPEANAQLYVKEQKENAPSWSSFLTDGTQLTDKDLGKNSSTGAVMRVHHAGQTFLIPFGMGHHMINRNAIDPGFGLTAALNSVDPESIRSADTATDKATKLNNRMQSGLGAEIFDFPINKEEDFLFAIAGESAVAKFGKKVVGRHSLTIQTNGDINGLPELLRTAYQQYQKKLPKPFRWVDNMRIVKNEKLRNELNDVLIDLLKQGATSEQCLWMAEAEVYDPAEVAGYSYTPCSKEYSDLLSLQRYLEALKQKDVALTIESLKKKRIFVKNASNETLNSWSGYDCLYAEFEHKGTYYALRSGVWYQINADFVKAVNDELANIPMYQHTLPAFKHKGEGEYNEDVAKNDSSITLLDKDNVYLGGGQSRFEFCDLLKNGTDIIHVKHYTGSATLSHLFNQGVVSAESFRKSHEAREKLYSKIPGVMPLADAAIPPNPSDYTIVYAIYGVDELPTKLPFFSKITLKNAYLNLLAMGYNVALAQVAITPKKQATSQPSPQSDAA